MSDKDLSLLFYGTLIDTPTPTVLRVRKNTLLGIDTGGVIVLLDELDDDATLEQGLEEAGVAHLVREKRVEVVKLSADEQYQYTGSATAVPLMTWLNAHAFPAESRMSDLQYARTVYTSLVERLLRNGTTTGLFYSTIHLEASKVLVDVLGGAGMRGFVGKVCMDINSPSHYTETTTSSLTSTTHFIIHVLSLNNPLLNPVITPRFVLTCSPTLLCGLADLARTHNLLIQTHACESEDEVAFVRDLYAGKEGWGDGADVGVLDRCGLVGEKTVLAHCTKCSEGEVEVLRERGAGVAHCPLSNFFFGDGVCGVRDLLRSGVKVGLGTDVAGGYSTSILNAMRDAVVASRCLVQFEYQGEGSRRDLEREVDFVRAFWLGTVGGAEVLGIAGKVGKFEMGMEFDACLVRCSGGMDGVVPVFDEDTVETVFEKFVNLGDDRCFAKVWVRGQKVV
ncbi:hypothetical protein HDV00_003290 [Rhizophlyctis rosea]|nr:hypothetical protein HDV00_003290 [Rhizophlyctis rosea]